MITNRTKMLYTVKKRTFSSKKNYRTYEDLKYSSIFLFLIDFRENFLLK